MQRRLLVLDVSGQCIGPIFKSQAVLIAPKRRQKLSRHRPGRALGFPSGGGSRTSRQSAHEGGKVVTPMHRPSLPPGKIRNVGN